MLAPSKVLAPQTNLKIQQLPKGCVPALAQRRANAVRTKAASSSPPQQPKQVDELGFAKMREGIKAPGKETILTPRL